MTTISEMRDKKKLAQKEVQAKRDKQLRIIFNEVCGDAEGILFMRHLMKICGYQQTSITGDPQTGDLQERGTFYNEARRSIYLEIRKYVKPRYLKQIEF